MYSSSSYFYKNTGQPSETSRCFIFTSAENFDRSVFIQLFVAVILNLLLKCKGVLSNILEHTAVMSPGRFSTLLLLTNLKNIKLQIIRIPRSPQYRMIRRLCPELHLPQPLMHILRRLPDGLGKQFLIHKMGTGAGRQISAVLHQLHSPQIDFPVTFHRFFD